MQADPPLAESMLSMRSGSAGYKGTSVFEDLTLELASPEITVLLGRSASGKSTLLRCLAGIQQLTSGTVTSAPTLRVAIQFQSAVLQPWQTVRRHIEIASQLSGRATSVETLLDEVGLRDAANARPHELSGGMKSRVAFARALAQSPDVLLLDEPYSGLDVVARNEMYDLLAKTVSSRQVAVLLVTHDLVEAVRLAHRMFVLVGKPARALEVGRLRSSIPRREEQLGEPDTCRILEEIRRALGKEL